MELMLIPQQGIESWLEDKSKWKPQRNKIMKLCGFILLQNSFATSVYVVAPHSCAEVYFYLLLLQSALITISNMHCSHNICDLLVQDYFKCCCGKY